MLTKEVITPDSGITVTIKTKKTHGDAKEIFRRCFADATVENLEDRANTLTLVQALDLNTITLELMIVSWSNEEPVTGESIDQLLTEDDVKFLLSQIGSTEEDKKK